jgi:hypothetical protein
MEYVPAPMATQQTEFASVVSGFPSSGTLPSISGGVTQLKSMDIEDFIPNQGPSLIGQYCGFVSWTSRVLSVVSFVLLVGCLTGVLVELCAIRVFVSIFSFLLGMSTFIECT